MDNCNCGIKDEYHNVLTCRRVRDFQKSTGMVYEIIRLLHNKMVGQEVSINELYKLIQMGQRVIDVQLKIDPRLEDVHDQKFLDMHIKCIR